MIKLKKGKQKSIVFLEALFISKVNRFKKVNTICYLSDVFVY